ncbi:hypothetical protein BKA63DRAFT_608419 [Paraphoma chrysanthemicola]|nr:hypothetical protein BKA63DRAFT_608419 [Paraphoma chrysanthemicola]
MSATDPFESRGRGGEPVINMLADVSVPDPVELDNILTVPSVTLTTIPLVIAWRQWRDYSDTYYKVECKNTTKGDNTVPLYISEGRLPAFRALDTANGADGKITFKVTRDFHYGLDNTVGKVRFLVYHDNKRMIIGGRFVNAALETLGVRASMPSGGVLGKF